MSALDRELLAERAMVVERHLTRVAERLPADPAMLTPASDASDAVVLHLWQAVQIVIDVALAACLQFNLGTPTSYAEAFRRLADAGVLTEDLAARLARAAGFATSWLTRTTGSTWRGCTARRGTARRSSGHFSPPWPTGSEPGA